jgi:hypothetical protein
MTILLFPARGARSNFTRAGFSAGLKDLNSLLLLSTALVPIGIPLFSSAPVDFFSTELFHSLLEIIIIMT